MKKNKGFTLIELLAVIIILSIIALITVPVIINIIEKSSRSVAIDSTYNYISALEHKIALSSLDNKVYKDKENYTLDEIKVDMKGKVPTRGLYTLKNRSVKQGTFCTNNYIVVYENNKAKVSSKGCSSSSLKLPGSIKLSNNSGNYTYPNSGTFEVIENISGGDLSCTSNDEKIATCEVSGNVVTVTPKTKEDTTTLTITSAETNNYREAKVSYLVTTTHGLLSVTANGYEGIYDGESYGITVTSSGSTIKYGTVLGTYNLDESPTYTNAGTYTVYYQVIKEGYKTVTSSKNVVINKANGSLNLSSESGEVNVGKSITITASNQTGTLSCTSDNNNIATCSVSNNTITVNGIGSGNTTITVKALESTNYKSTSKTYTVTIKRPILESTNSCITGENICTNGTSVTVNVNDTTSYNFYVIGDTGSELTLIMDRNLGGRVAWISQADYEAVGGIKWGSLGNNEKGPLTILRALKNRTANWTNIPSYSYTLTDEFNNRVYKPIEVNDVRARLLTKSEAGKYGCNSKCASYLVGNTSSSNTEENPYGYWTSTGSGSYSHHATGIFYTGGFNDMTVRTSGNYGIRPVIVIPKN